MGRIFIFYPQKINPQNDERFEGKYKAGNNVSLLVMTSKWGFFDFTHQKLRPKKIQD